MSSHLNKRIPFTSHSLFPGLKAGNNPKLEMCHVAPDAALLQLKHDDGEQISLDDRLRKETTRKEITARDQSQEKNPVQV